MTAAEYENAAAFMASIGVRCPQREALQFGGVIGSVFVRDIVNRSDSPWFRKGATALVFADARPEPFMPVLGQTGPVAMIRVSISVEAFEAIAKTLPLAASAPP
jgi:hypothetical protein